MAEEDQSRLDLRKEEQGLPIGDLSLQQQVLSKAMLLGYGLEQQQAKILAVDYQLDSVSGQKTVKGISEQTELDQLIENFRQDPKQALAFGRINLVHIARDQRISSLERQARLRRYLKAYLDLTIDLDRVAFPPDYQVKKGVPFYIPDGFSDMGSHPEVDPSKRGREKIRVVKEEIFKQHFVDLANIFTKLAASGQDPSTADIKKYIVDYIAAVVCQKMPYDFKQRAEKLGRLRSVPVHEVQARRMAVCRHQALYVQVLLQSLGLTSQLLKCNLDGYSHVANLLRIDNKWHVLDVTNPEKGEDGKLKVFIRQIPEIENPYKDDLEHKWQFPAKKKDGTIGSRVYQLRRNMFYRIMDNDKG